MQQTPLPTLADRAWFAYHCLPREEGELPSYRQLEMAYGLSTAIISKIVLGTREHFWPETMPKLAEALRCNVDWLRAGTGPAPRLPHGVSVPPRPRTFKRYGDLPGWDAAVSEAKARPSEEKMGIPDAWFRAGAEMEIGRAVTDDMVTADLAIFVSGHAYYTATKEQQTRYSTLEARAASRLPRARHLRRPAVK